GLFTQHLASHHLLEQFGYAKRLATLISSDSCIEVSSDVDRSVETHDIERSKCCALGVPDQWACECVNLLDRVVTLDHRLDSIEHCKRANPIGDEVGRVFGIDNALAQNTVAEPRDEAGDLSGGLRSAYQFQQMEVSRRVEEMRTEKPLPEALTS